MQTHAEPTLVEFVRYNNWATQQVLAVCLDLSDSQLLAKIPGAYGSIRETVGHMLYAEVDYIGRITGTRPEAPFIWQEGPTLAEMAAFAPQIGEALVDVVLRTPATQIVREEEDGKFIEYRASQLFMQAINHGIEHRTNITTLLNNNGIAVPEVDNWGYMWAHPDRFDLKEGNVAGS